LKQIQLEDTVVEEADRREWPAYIQQGNCNWKATKEVEDKRNEKHVIAFLIKVVNREEKAINKL
jgi:hypothetical protein